jgi:ornithine cyclodeaminase
LSGPAKFSEQKRKRGIKTLFDDDVLILKGDEVRALLQGQEHELMRTVRAAYEAHAGADSSLPQSTFLRFPQEPRNRIIALPAYLGQKFEVAGIKWIASFPGNHDAGLDRASAVIILNSAETGRPRAIIEGSIISAKRTAASAALAAMHLRGETGTFAAGLIGCGPINFEIARFLLKACPEVVAFHLYDRHEGSARRFEHKCRELSVDIEIVIEDDAESVLRCCPLVSFATTAPEPHIFALPERKAGTTLLHISLRDLSPELILSCDNVVDDIEHVCRAQTSVHLTEQLVGNRDFIRCTLADIFTGAAPARRDAETPVIFSPFGLGVLDLAVSQMVYERARAEGVGTTITSFLPDPWSQSKQEPILS